MRIILFGATGLVGGAILEAALKDDRIDSVIAPTRRPLAPRDKLENPVGDPAAYHGDEPWWQSNAAISALGTTIRTAGSQAAFVKIDHALVTGLATKARAAGVERFGLVSSLGADPKSPTFYLKIKGQTERDITALGFPSLTIIRPSLLDALGRKDARPAEAVGVVAGRFLRPFIPKAYRPVTPEAVGRVLLAAVMEGEGGVRVIESGEINA